MGGPDRRILTAGRIAGSGTWGVFTRWLWGEGPHARPMVVLESNRYMKNLLAASDQAIGYLPLGWTNERVHALALATKAGVIRPTAARIRAGRWPMARRLTLWLRPDASSSARDFVEFMASDAARPLLERAGYLPAVSRFAAKKEPGASRRPASHPREEEGASSRATFPGRPGRRGPKPSGEGGEEGTSAPDRRQYRGAG